MIYELLKQASPAAQDLLAREQMGLLDLSTNEQEFLDAACEAASEYLPPPADRSLESFDLLVGAIISGFFSAKAVQAMKRQGEL